MQISYFDSPAVTDAKLQKTVALLKKYRAHTLDVVERADFSQPESSLACFADEEAISHVYDIASHFRKLDHVILVGIGGQALGIEALHAGLYEGGTELHVLDTISPHEIFAVMKQLEKVKNVERIAVCVSSKSGSTTETLTNATTLLSLLEKKFGKKIYKQTVCIGTEKNNLLTYGKKVDCHILPFQKIVGGRYSVFTAAGLLPLLLLQHDIEGLLAGLEDATDEEFEETVAESASLLYLYMKEHNTHTLNFFSFDTRLVRLGKWTRQLVAESIGKKETKKGTKNKLSMQPIVSTAVELHSTGQLYFSGFPGVYTDFVLFSGEHDEDLTVPKTNALAKTIKLSGMSHQKVLSATFEGVLSAYRKTKLPYRATMLEGDKAYALGLFMGMRMLETMYLASLMNVDAFNQPNVELYKEFTREELTKQ